jgi:hypothetical protein
VQLVRYLSYNRHSTISTTLYTGYCFLLSCKSPCKRCASFIVSLSWLDCLVLSNQLCAEALKLLLIPDIR